jgi:hypothetical protein
MKHDWCAWSYFLPRLGPSPISTPDFEIATGPELFLRCGRTLRQLRQIVTTICDKSRRFCAGRFHEPPAHFLRRRKFGIFARPVSQGLASNGARIRHQSSVSSTPRCSEREKRGEPRLTGWRRSLRDRSCDSCRLLPRIASPRESKLLAATGPAGRKPPPRKAW